MSAYPARPYPTTPASRFLRAASIAAWASLAWDPSRWWVWLTAALLTYLAAFLLEARIRDTSVNPVDVAVLALHDYGHDLHDGLAEYPITREDAISRATRAEHLIYLDARR